MAIYKVTDLKTGKETVQVDLEDLYNERRTESELKLNELESFAQSMHENVFAQEMAGVKVELLDDPFTALANAKAEYKDAQAQLTKLKPLISKLVDESLKDDDADLDRTLKHSIAPITKIQKRIEDGSLNVSEARRKKIMEKKPRKSSTSNG